ncbi:hypothetical protein CMI37_05275 [Candidatus Pacearchaeota archaeon]|nr:hypothetical protein [Candidatus Pacearchaeota archaeon]|tara:strand:- start:1120 stop:1650 length:531 start_codon:yes stop_codon:yes gene_type:complete
MYILVDSYSEANRDGQGALSSANEAEVGQSFTGTAGYLGKVTFHIRKTGSPTGSAVAKLYAHTGVFGTSSLPTGGALATSNNFDVSTLTTSFVLRDLFFSGANRYLLVAGTKYFISIGYTGGNGSNKVEPGYDSSAPSHGGNYGYENGGWTAAAAVDACFYVYTVIEGASFIFNMI